MLEFPDFGHMSTSIIGDVMGKHCEVITFTWKYFILQMHRVAKFADIIKIATIFIKTTL